MKQDVREILKAQGLTLTESATQVGISLSHLSRILNGERKNIKPAHLQRIAQLLKISPNRLQELIQQGSEPESSHKDRQNIQ